MTVRYYSKEMRKYSKIIGYTGSLGLPWIDKMSGHGDIIY